MYYPKSAVYHILQLDKPRIVESPLPLTGGEENFANGRVVVRKGETLVEPKKEVKAKKELFQVHKASVVVKRHDDADDYEEFFKEYKY